MSHCPNSPTEFKSDSLEAGPWTRCEWLGGLGWGRLDWQTRPEARYKTGMGSPTKGSPLCPPPALVKCSRFVGWLIGL